MSAEELAALRRRIDVRRKCQQEDRQALARAMSEVSRFERAIALDEREIAEAQAQINAHWEQVVA